MVDSHLIFPPGSKTFALRHRGSNVYEYYETDALGTPKETSGVAGYAIAFGLCVWQEGAKGKRLGITSVEIRDKILSFKAPVSMLDEIISYLAAFVWGYECHYSIPATELSPRLGKLRQISSNYVGQTIDSNSLKKWISEIHEARESFKKDTDQK